VHLFLSQALIFDFLEVPTFKECKKWQ